MMVYLLFVPVLVFQVYLIVTLFRARRDDRVRFQFCAFQAEIIAFLNTEEGKSLSRTDYTFTRWLIEVNTLTIQQFNKIKSSFNISSTLKGLRFFDHKVVTPAHRLENIENVKVHDLYHGFIGYTTQAFVAYTPFLKSKFALRLFLATARLLAVVGILRVHLWVRELLERWSTIKNENEYYCPI
jgi:hypothetical protein